MSDQGVGADDLDDQGFPVLANRAVETQMLGGVGPDPIVSGLVAGLLGKERAGAVVPPVRREFPCSPVEQEFVVDGDGVGGFVVAGPEDGEAASVKAAFTFGLWKRLEPVAVPEQGQGVLAGRGDGCDQGRRGAPS